MSKFKVGDIVMYKCGGISITNIKRKFTCIGTVTKINKISNLSIAYANFQIYINRATCSVENHCCYINRDEAILIGRFGKNKIKLSKK